MKLLYYIGFTTTIIGIAGMAGAIQLGTGYYTSTVLLIIGITAFVTGYIENSRTYQETDQEIIDLADYKRRRKKDAGHNRTAD